MRSLLTCGKPTNRIFHVLQGYDRLRFPEEEEPVSIPPFRTLLVGDRKTEVTAIDVSPTTDLLLIGQGYNSITGEQRGMAVEFGGTNDELIFATAAEEPKTDWTLVQISNLQQLRDALAIPAAAAFGIGIFDTDAVSNFLGGNMVNSYDSYLLVDVVVRNRAEVLKQPRLTNAALDQARLALKERHPAPFLDFAGNSYVYGWRTGRRLTAVVQFPSKDSTDHQKVHGSVAAAIASSGAGRQRVGKPLADLSKIADARTHILRGCGAGELQSLGDLARAADELPNLADEGKAPAVLEFFLRGYDDLAAMPNGILDEGEMHAQRATMEKLARHLNAAYEARGDLEYVLSHPGQFTIRDRRNGEYLTEVAKGGQKQNEGIIRNLNAAVRKLAQDPRFKVSGEPLSQTPERLGIKRVRTKTKAATPILQLYQGANYAGERYDLFGSMNDLAAAGFNEGIRSFVLNGAPAEFTATFYRDAEFTDRMFSVQSPAAIPNCRPQFPLYQAASVRIARNT